MRSINANRNPIVTPHRCGVYGALRSIMCWMRWFRFVTFADMACGDNIGRIADTPDAGAPLLPRSSARIIVPPEQLTRAEPALQTRRHARRRRRRRKVCHVNKEATRSSLVRRALQVHTTMTYSGWEPACGAKVKHVPASISARDMWAQFIAARKPVVIDGLLDDAAWHGERWVRNRSLTQEQPRVSAGQGR